MKLCIGGCGAIALLVGQDAAIVVDRNLLAIHSADSHEFCRPIGAGPFPVFDGHKSTLQFFNALDICYGQLCTKAKMTNCNKQPNLEHGRTFY